MFYTVAFYIGGGILFALFIWGIIAGGTKPKSPQPDSKTPETSTSVDTDDSVLSTLECRYSDEREMKDKHYAKVKQYGKTKKAPYHYCGGTFAYRIKNTYKNSSSGYNLSHFKDATTYYERYYYEHIGLADGGWDIYYKDLSLSHVACICRRLLDQNQKIVSFIERVNRLEKLNSASYLCFVREALIEVHQYILDSLNPVVNYLLIDGCLDCFETELSAEHHRKISDVITKNDSVLAKSKTLLDEAVEMVNSIELKGDSDVATDALDASIRSIRSTIIVNSDI